MESFMEKYDVIIIGGGNGGLASAATLSEKGKKVLLFERHNIPGGCGTSFRRGRFEFETALHQLSQMNREATPGPLRKIFRRWGIEKQLEWIEIKDLYRVNFPDGSGVTIPCDRAKAENYLIEKFPSEKENILRYYQTVYDFCKEAAEFSKKSASSTSEPGALKKAIMKVGFPKLYPTLAKYALRSTQDVLDEFFKDAKLQLGLSAYWCFMGMPPSRFPWSILAKCTNIYIEDKPYFPVGTSMMMNQAIMEAAIRMGATVKLNCGVKKIILENGKAVGVIDEKGKEYRSKKIISNISPITTYGSLLDKDEIPEAAKEYLKPYTVGISVVDCFIGLDCPPEEIGWGASFTLNYNSLDANGDFMDAYKLLPENDPLVATCYTVDSEKLSPKNTSIITAGTLKYSAEWEKLTPEQYYEKKNEAGDRIIARLEKLYPGLRSHIEEIEIATPLTFERFLNHPGGAIYGYEQDLTSSVFFYPQQGMIENLEFASGWVNTCGFGPNYIYGDQVATRVAKEV